MDLGTIGNLHVDVAVETIAGCAGLTPESARQIIDVALRRELPDGYHGDDGDRERAIAALDTLVALYERDWPKPGTGIEELEVSFRMIDVDRDIQVRVDGVTPERVQQFMDAMEAGDVFPPITLFWDEAHRALWLADGFHRVQASRRIGDTIRAHIYAGDIDAAVEYAATCNARHGLPMTSADKRAAVKRIVTLHRDDPEPLSSREIARRVGCSHPFVENIRKEIEQPKPSLRMVTRAGSTYSYTPPAAKEPEPEPETQSVEEWLDEHAPAPYQPIPTPEPRPAAAPIARVDSPPAPLEDWQRVRLALVQRDYRALRQLLMAVPRLDFRFALQAIYREFDAVPHDQAAQTLLSAIFEPWDEPLSGNGHDTVEACPECGGELFLSLSNSGKGTLACRECGAVLDAA